MNTIADGIYGQIQVTKLTESVETKQIKLKLRYIRSFWDTNVPLWSWCWWMNREFWKACGQQPSLFPTLRNCLHRHCLNGRCRENANLGSMHKMKPISVRQNNSAVPQIVRIEA
ncbi:hypothetical protein ACTXT7_004486 [Hymenolepis weldensis]